MAFHVFSMKPLSFLSDNDKKDFGLKEIGILVDHYGKEAQRSDKVSKALIDEVQTLEEWTLAKTLVMEQMYPRDSTRIHWKLMFDNHRDVLPNLITLANLALIMAYQTADCERAFSAQNAIKTPRRSRLHTKHLNDLMTIRIEGEKDLSAFDLAPAVTLWKNKKERRVFKQLS